MIWPPGAAAKAGKVDEALALREEMRQEGVDRNTISYTSAISAAARLHRSAAPSVFRISRAAVPVRFPKPFRSSRPGLQPNKSGNSQFAPRFCN